MLYFCKCFLNLFKKKNIKVSPDTNNFNILNYDNQLKNIISEYIYLVHNIFPSEINNKTDTIILTVSIYNRRNELRSYFDGISNSIMNEITDNNIPHHIYNIINKRHSIYRDQFDNIDESFLNNIISLHIFKKLKVEKLLHTQPSFINIFKDTSIPPKV
jgi:hypothetical protein